MFLGELRNLRRALAGAFDSSGKRNPQVFDGISFWTELDEIAKILAAEAVDDRRVVLVGAGGTAAAIAYWFATRASVCPSPSLAGSPLCMPGTPATSKTVCFPTRPLGGPCLTMLATSSCAA